MWNYAAQRNFVCVIPPNAWSYLIFLQNCYGIWSLATRTLAISSTMTIILFTTLFVRGTNQADCRGKLSMIVLQLRRRKPRIVLLWGRRFPKRKGMVQTHRSVRLLMRINLRRTGTTLWREMKVMRWRMINLISAIAMPRAGLKEMEISLSWNNVNALSRAYSLGGNNSNHASSFILILILLFNYYFYS